MSLPRPSHMIQTKRLIVAVVAIAGVLLATSVPGVARDQLVIGITQFPSTFHPNIDAMLAKSYVLGMTRRPFTVTVFGLMFPPFTSRAFSASFA